MLQISPTLICSNFLKIRLYVVRYICTNLHKTPSLKFKFFYYFFLFFNRNVRFDRNQTLLRMQNRIKESRSIDLPIDESIAHLTGNSTGVQIILKFQIV